MSSQIKGHLLNCKTDNVLLAGLLTQLQSVMVIEDASASPASTHSAADTDSDSDETAPAGVAAVVDSHTDNSDVSTEVIDLDE